MSQQTFTSRRSLLKAGLGLSMSSLMAQQRTPGNVLFIAADDLNHSMSTFGHPLVHTPNIDRIARAGVKFDHSYCQFPLCSPSRSSLMTGLAPDTTQVYDLKRHFRESLPNVVTLPQLYQKNGGRSMRVGKIYHYGNPGQIGTDGLDDAPSWNERINPKGVDKTEEEPKLTNYTPDRGIGSALCFYASPKEDKEHTDGKVASETIRLMEENRDRSWFLGAGFYKPHCPYIAPKKYFDQIPIDKIKLIPFDDSELSIAPRWAYFTRPGNWGLTERQRLESMQAYFATILFLDAQIGRVLDALERLKLQDKTTIVFWSDHGYQLGEHGQWMKQTVFEPAARSPMIVAGPGVRAKGKTCSRVVEFLDIYPTVADLAGLHDAPSNLHGTSLRPLLDNPGAAWDRPAISQVRRGNGDSPVDGYSLRTTRYRYTMWNNGKEGEELYDYQKDPREMTNLAKSGNAADQKLKSALRGQLDEVLRKRRPSA